VPPTQGVNQDTGREPDPAETAEFLDRMRAERFDLALQMHGGGRLSNPLIRSVEARTAVGLLADDAEPLDLNLPYVYYQHEVLRQLELVSLIGAVAGRITPSLAVTVRDRAAVEAVLGTDGGRVVVLHPGANDPRRRWAAQSFAEVGDALVVAGADVVITGVESERTVAEEVASRMQRPAQVAAGRLSIPGLVGLLDRAVLVVSNDTGPRHLAEAVGTATVSIYWAGNLVNAGPLTRRRHRPHVSRQLTCPDCGVQVMGSLHPDRRTECEHRSSLVADIPVGEVLADALELLGQGSVSQQTGTS
jgi:ADP-heptose:LPS heptosyltransferase